MVEPRLTLEEYASEILERTSRAMRLVARARDYHLALAGLYASALDVIDSGDARSLALWTRVPVPAPMTERQSPGVEELGTEAEALVLDVREGVQEQGDQFDAVAAEASVIIAALQSLNELASQAVRDRGSRHVDADGAEPISHEDSSAVVPGAGHTRADHTVEAPDVVVGARDSSAPVDVGHHDATSS